MKRNFFKSKPFIICIIVISILISMMSFAFAGGDLFKLPKKNIDGRYLSEEEIKAFSNSEEGKKNKENTNKRLNDAWEDIKDVYKMDEEKYIKISLEEIYSKTIEDKYTIFEDSAFLDTFLKEIRELQKGRQIGSLMPTILVSLEKDEIILAYKDKDGSNILKNSILEDGKWKRNNYKKEGKSILEFSE